MNKTLLRKYARTIVRVGANVQKGQPVVVTAAVDQHPFVQYLVEEAYRAGASRVDVEWRCQPLTKLHYRHQSMTSLSRVTAAEEAKLQQWVDELPCQIHITSEDPDGLRGVNRGGRRCVACVGT